LIDLELLCAVALGKSDRFRRLVNFDSVSRYFTVEVSRPIRRNFVEEFGFEVGGPHSVQELVERFGTEEMKIALREAMDSEAERYCLEEVVSHYGLQFDNEF